MADIDGRIETVDLDRIDRSERVGHWEEVVSVTHLDVTSRPDAEADPRPFRARIRRQWIDDVAVLDCTCMPCHGERGRSRIAAAAGEFVGVLQLRRGVERLVQDDEHAELTPGSVVAWDSRRPVRYSVPTLMTKRNLFLPLAAVEEVSASSWQPGGAVLDPAAPATRLLLSYLDVLVREAAVLEGVAATAARNAAVELFVAAVAGGPAPAPAPALRGVVDAWIERRLGQALTPARIAAAHGISVRTAHRLYESTGETLGGYIRQRRLARAYEQVVGGDQAMAVIARRWGFASSSHFTRSFRARFGATPSEVRGAARRTGPPPDTPALGAHPRPPGPRLAPADRAGARAIVRAHV